MQTKNPTPSTLCSQHDHLLGGHCVVVAFASCFFASCIYELPQRSSDCKLISKNPIESFSSPILVHPTRLERAISTLKGLWLNQFAHGCIFLFERKTRLELATNSLEGCDSTIELLPHLCTCGGT